MQIDNTTYALPLANYHAVQFPKKVIVIGHTHNSGMRHVAGWKTRHNGQYKKTAAFTIDLKGQIYQHFDPRCYGMLFDDPEWDFKSIVILLENEGWLAKNDDKNEFINYIGHIYNRTTKVFMKVWRKKKYWAPYTKKQMDSAAELCKMLCADFQIPRVVTEHNTSLPMLQGYEGILYKSNIDKLKTEPSPAWDCTEFKNKIEVKLIENE